MIRKARYILVVSPFLGIDAVGGRDYYRYIGLHVYRVGFLKEYVHMPGPVAVWNG